MGMALFLNAITVSKVISDSKAITVAVALFSALISSASADWLVEAEALAIKPAYNEVQIPNTMQADRFEITDIGADISYSGRLTLGWLAEEAHEVQFVYAPLSYTQSGQFKQDIRFNGDTFVKEAPTDVRYKFDNYRLRYLYTLFDSARWKTDVGGTLFIRDASIRLRQAGLSNAYDNIGFVPLLAFRTAYSLNQQWSFKMDVDLAFAPQGRAIDFAALAQYDLNNHWKLAAGYRTIEGGADNEKVYSFAWLNAAVLKASYYW